MTAKWGGWQIRNVDETEQQAFRNGRGKSELARGSGNISEREAGRSSGAKAFERERECVCVSVQQQQQFYPSSLEIQA